MPSLDILLVEDVELNVTVACALLNKLGHQVKVARDGAEALAMANPDDFDLILLDIQLPDMTGFDVAEQLLARYGDSPAPMVALTANATGDRQYYRDHGMQDVINKPLGSKAVREVIGHLFADLAGDEADERDDVHHQDALLDLPFLTDYASTVGKPVLLSSVELFEKMMPDYMAVLDSNMIARDQAGVVEEAHKIKGAAGSIGLRRLQQTAQLIQSPDHPAWWENVEDWIETLRREYPGDIARLRRWLLVDTTPQARSHDMYDRFDPPSAFTPGETKTCWRRRSRTAPASCRRRRCVGCGRRPGLPARCESLGAQPPHPFAGGAGDRSPDQSPHPGGAAGRSGVRGGLHQSGGDVRLLHDVGNPPFGHFGEQVMSQWLAQELDGLFARAHDQLPSPSGQPFARICWCLTAMPRACDWCTASELNLTLGQLAALCKYPQQPCRACTIPRAMVSTTAGPASAASSSANNPLSCLGQSLGLAEGAVIRWSTSWEAADDISYHRRSRGCGGQAHPHPDRAAGSLREADEGGFTWPTCSMRRLLRSGFFPIFASI